MMALMRGVNMRRLPLAALSLWLVLAVGLSGCGNLCPLPDSLEVAARYKDDVNGGYDLPSDVWTRNRDVEFLLRSVVKTEGVAALWSEFHMQCFPAPTTGCADCQHCTASRRQEYAVLRFPVSYRDNRGEILIRAEVGPGSTVSAMTYWRKRPVP